MALDERKGLDDIFDISMAPVLAFDGRNRSNI